MPYCKIIPVIPAALASVARYLADASHGNHLEYELTPIEVLGAKSAAEFIEHAHQCFEANKLPNGRRRAGRKPRNAANWFIVRTPDQTWLSKEEEEAIEQEVEEVAGNGKPIAGIKIWHKNKLTGSADFNLLQAAFLKGGRWIRDRSRHPIKNLRRRMDAVVENLNVKRKIRGIPQIQTMQEVQRAKRKEKKIRDMAKELAMLPIPPRKLVDLHPALLLIGCEITRINPDKNTICVIKPGMKKAVKLSITGLLADVHATSDQIQSQPKQEPDQSRLRAAV